MMSNTRERWRHPRRGYLDKSWVYLDEAQEAGRIPGLDKVIQKGPGKGVVVCLRPQSVMGLREIYGRETTTSNSGCLPRCEGSGTGVLV